MKKILWLSKRVNSNPSKLVKKLNLLSRKEDGNDLYTQIDYQDIIIKLDVKDNVVLANEVNILDYDLIFFRNWRKYQPLATALALFLESHNKKFIDKAAGSSKSGNKILQMMMLSLNNLPIPKSLFVVNFKNLSRIKAHLEGFLEYPYVIKAASSRLGRNNHLVKDSKEFDNLLTNLNKKSGYLIQEFIPNSFDYRLLVLGGEVKVAERNIRGNSHIHLNNPAQGSREEFIQLSEVPDLIPLAIDATKLFGRQIAGVDIVVSTLTNKPYILEVNPSPGISYNHPSSTEVAELHTYLKSLI